MNIWVKSDPLFDSDDTLEAYLADAKGVVMMFESTNRYTYRDLPKYLIYATQLYMMSKYGDQPQIPFLNIGNTNTKNVIYASNNFLGVKYKRIK